MSANEQEQHGMKRSAAYSTGWEEFTCETCGRRFLMRWPPQHDRVVLEPGNEYATHYYSTEGLDLTHEIQQPQAQEEDPEQAKRLDVYEEFLRQRKKKKPGPSS